MKKVLNGIDTSKNEIEKNIYITDLKYILHTEFKEQIEKDGINIFTAA